MIASARKMGMHREVADLENRRKRLWLGSMLSIFRLPSVAGSRTRRRRRSKILVYSAVRRGIA